MQRIQISKMERDDIIGIYEVEKESFPVPWPMSSFEEELNNLFARYLVAKINNRIVGYIGLWFVMDECHITNIAVLPEFRRNKVASKLVNEMFRLCKFYETSYILLEVRKSNVPAINFYKKIGFKEDSIRKDYYKNPDNTREDAILMSLEL